MDSVADIPAKVGRPSKMGLAQWVSIILVTSLYASLAWGARVMQFGQIQGMEVEGEFYGYSQQNQKGEFVFPSGKHLAYKIRIKNRSNKSFANMEVQSSLHSDGATCPSMSLYPGARLPGAALSPVHTISLSPGTSQEYEVVYPLSNDICNSSGHLKVRIQYSLSGRLHSSTLLAPAHYRIE